MPHQHIINDVTQHGTPLWAKVMYAFIFLCFFPPIGRPVLFTIGVLIRLSLNYLILRPLNFILQFFMRKIKIKSR